MLVFVGLPWERGGKLYNVAAAVKDGELLGLVPKTNLPNYQEFYEARHFCPGNEIPVEAAWEGGTVPMGANLLFSCKNAPGLMIGAEVCEDVWVPCPPSIRHCMAGATVMVNCSASDETTGKDAYRRELIDRGCPPVPGGTACEAPGRLCGSDGDICGRPGRRFV